MSNSSFLCKQLVVSRAEKRLFGHPHQNRWKSLCTQAFPEIEGARHPHHTLTQPSPYPHQSQAAQNPLLLVSLGEMPFWLTRNAVSRRAKWHFSVYCVVFDC